MSVSKLTGKPYISLPSGGGEEGEGKGKERNVNNNMQQVVSNWQESNNTIQDLSIQLNNLRVRREKRDPDDREISRETPLALDDVKEGLSLLIPALLSCRQDERLALISEFKVLIGQAPMLMLLHQIQHTISTNELDLNIVASAWYEIYPSFETGDIQIRDKFDNVLTHLFTQHQNTIQNNELKAALNASFERDLEENNQLIEYLIQREKDLLELVRTGQQEYQEALANVRAELTAAQINNANTRTAIDLTTGVIVLGTIAVTATVTSAVFLILIRTEILKNRK